MFEICLKYKYDTKVNYLNKFTVRVRLSICFAFMFTHNYLYVSLVFVKYTDYQIYRNCVFLIHVLCIEW